MSRLLLIRVGKKIVYTHDKPKPQSYAPLVKFYGSTDLGNGGFYMPFCISFGLTAVRCECIKLAVDLADINICNSCQWQKSSDYARVLLGISPKNIRNKDVLIELLSECKQIDLRYKLKL